jgi:hypothetical protein
MTPRTVIYSVIGLWLFIAAVVIAYPLLSGQIRVGFDPVRRDTAPQQFWSAYIVSTALFLAVSAVVGFTLRAMVS